MAGFKNIEYSKFTKDLLVVTGIVYILDFVTGGKISTLLELNPSLIIGNLEAWRLFTFPFAYGSTESVFIFLATFFIFSNKIEESVSKFHFPLLIGMLVLSQGVITTVAFWGMDVTLGGMEGVALYFMTLSVVFYGFEKRRVFGLFKIKNWMLISVVFILWLASKVMSFYYYNDGIAITLSPLAFGLVMSLLTAFQVSFKRRSSSKSKSEPVEEFSEDEPNYRPAMVSSEESLKYNEIKCVHRIFFSRDPLENEEQLNKILDKMNTLGKQALSKDEWDFLKEYSKTIK